MFKLWKIAAEYFSKRRAQAGDPPPSTAPPPVADNGGSPPPKPPPPALSPRVLLAEECREEGYRTARKSGLLKPHAPTLQALEADATGRAHAAHRPASDVKDRQRMERLKALEETRERQTLHCDRIGIVHLSEVKERLAKLGAPRSYPALSIILRYSAVLGLSISIAPTFHDLLVGLDAFLKWVGGGACAVGVSLFIVYGIIPPPTDPDQSGGK